MRRSSGIAFLVALIAAALSCIVASPATAATRSCGYVEPHEYHVKIEQGHVSCEEARKAIATVIRGGGKRHGNPHLGLEGLYWTIPGGWRCGTGAGGAWGCVRGGTRTKPRDRISAEQRAEEEIAHGNY
jgi:hypothetical protein